MVPLPQPSEPSAFPSAQNPTPISNRQPKSSEASTGYSSVNQLSVLPGDVRTATNLVGGTVPTDQERLLLEMYRKERADYEQQQLQKMVELKAMREGGASQVPAVVEGGVMYEDVDPTSSSALRAEAQEAPAEINPYQFPVDAVTLAPARVVGVAKKSPKTLGMGTGVIKSSEAYTAVFNTLPKGHVLEKVPPSNPQPRTRALSDSSQPSSSVKAATVTYENSPWVSPSKDSPEQACKVVPSSGSGSEGVWERNDANRVSKRKLAKEVVEFDPNKQGKFRMTSNIRNQPEGNGADLNNQVDGGTDSSMARPFSIHADQQGLSYAMVNMEDKQRYRLEANVAKREGSGTPQHYRVPIASS